MHFVILHNFEAKNSNDIVRATGFDSSFMSYALTDTYASIEVVTFKEVCREHLVAALLWGESPNHEGQGGAEGQARRNSCTSVEAKNVLSQNCARPISSDSSRLVLTENGLNCFFWLAPGGASPT